MAIPTEPLTKGVTLIPGDCLDVLAAMDADSIDSCVTDPPYHLTSGNAAVDWSSMGPHPYSAKRPNIGPTNKSGRGHKTGFMGKSWDGGDIAFRPEIWAQVLRVLRPGGHLLSFGGTRTYHRMACAIEDAGFEIRDCCSWNFGSGFPKSLDVSKAIDKAAGVQREVVGVKSYPREGTTPVTRKATSIYQQGGGENVGQDSNVLTAPATDAARQWDGWGTALKPAMELICLARKPLSESTVAANVLKWGTGALNIDGCRVGTDEAIVPFGSPKRSVGGIMNGTEAPREQFTQSPQGRWPANVIHDGSDEVVGAFPESKAGNDIAERGTGGIWSPSSGLPCGPQYGDSGSAARFFYTAKADSDDRLGSKHPTVKPVDLIQYLVRLVTPPRGLVLDPFAGTGTTGEACIREKLRCILIEREAEYCDDIRRRMRLAMCGPDERVRESAKARNPNPDLGPLFQDYDAQKDLAGSIADGFAAIRERKAAGGQGWGE